MPANKMPPDPPASTISLRNSTARRWRYWNRSASLRSAVYALAPWLQSWWLRINEAIAPRTFSGWGLQTTEALPPWASSPDRTAREFLSAHAALVEAVEAGAFALTLSGSATDKARWLAGLMWRHYIIFTTAREARAATRVNTIMECGSAEGMSAWFALHGADGARAYLYDLFGTMTDRSLLPSEMFSVGNYATLSREHIAHNLHRYPAAVELCPGFIPESFAMYPPPPTIAWLHIDLNAAAPTLATLTECWERVAPGGLVLFDDYGWKGWVDTKRTVDGFFASRVPVWQLPTGQAIVRKPAEVRSLSR
jgi:hypothetical protein